MRLASILAAVILAGFFLWFGYRNVEAETQDKAWDVVVIGDSIIGKERTDGTVDGYFEEYSGMTMLNGAFGGNCASVSVYADRYSSHEESLTLKSLAEALCYRDFGVQRADLVLNQVKVQYFDEVMEQLSGVDLRRTEIILIAFGTNDYLAGKMTDNPEDPYDVRTYGGALRYAVELFRKTYPDLEIILVAPPFCHIDGHDNCFEKDFGGETLDKYVETEKQIAAEYGVYMIDALHEFDLNEENYAEYMEGGGLHLNKEGRRMYARFLAESIQEFAERKSE